MKNMLSPAIAIIAIILAVGFVLVLTSPAQSLFLPVKLTIEKTVDFDDNGVFHDSETNYRGNTATWRIVVKNTSTCTPGCNITSINITDTNGWSFGPFDLEQGESRTFEYDQTINVCGPNEAGAEGVYQLNIAQPGTPPVYTNILVGPVYDDAEVVCLPTEVVGIDVYSINKAGLLVPWLILVVLLVGGTSWLLLLNRRA
jgi:hypothetical protein